MAPIIAAEKSPIIGFWGPSTSTIDWCEENYAVSKYIAEFWNTVSCLVMVVPPMLGIYQCQRERLEPRFTLSYLTILAVGLGSMLFHGTLLFEMELLDEIPMMIAVAHMVYCLSETNSAFNVISRRGYLVLVAVGTYTFITTLIYLLVKDHTIFQGIFVLMLLLVAVLGVHVVWSCGQCRHRAWLIACIALFLFAIFVWSIDVHLCPMLRQTRRHLYWGKADFVTQLHSWWHLLTGTGAYLFIVTSSRLRMEVLGYQTKIKTFLCIPYLTVRAKFEL